MIEEIVPPTVVAEEAFVDLEGVALFPDEEVVVARAVAKRRREFATARHCARAALRRLGVAPVPILPGERGAPQWPAGIVGSLTHCDGYRAAAVAHRRDVVSIGVDAEPHGPLPDGILDLIAVAAERAMIERLGAEVSDVCWDRLLFCAKESVYKAWYPMTGRWLDFEDAEVSFDPIGGCFVARLLVPGPVVGGERRQELAGRYTVGRGLVVSAITVLA